MSSVVHKNPFDLLDNDDGSDTPSGPVHTVDKVSTRTAKRNTDGEAPVKPATNTGNRRGGSYTGSEAAIRDRGAGHDRNRGKPTEEAARGGPRGGHTARVRGGRGSRHPRDRDDRHSKGLPSGSEKQADKSWGGPEGEAELKDEQAGEEIAKTEEKEAAVEGEASGEAKAEGYEESGEPAEEDKHITLADYLAQQAEKKLALEAENTLAVRKPNEGIKESKKWAGAKPLVKEDDDNYFAGSGGKAKRERERKTKQIVEIDQRFVEPERPRGGSRGGPRGGRGDSARGRGDSGRGDSFRGSGRGGPRGGRGDFRGDFRGGRGGAGRGENQAINTNDTSAFPSLGGA